MGKNKTKKKTIAKTKAVKKTISPSDTQKEEETIREQNISSKDKIIREPAEKKYFLELQALCEADEGNFKPTNWSLSPKMVLKYILGQNSKDKFETTVNNEIISVKITKKFYGDSRIVERALVTLASDRGLLLVGEPGTGKSWLSEHLAAAISGNSTFIIQGTAGTTEEQIKYGWNIALLIAEGQNKNSLIPSPTMQAMQRGKILRFEEVTRCISDVQDSLVSIMSEKSIVIPELVSDNIIFAKPGFNIIATANLRDKGVNELSAALKRRFNYIRIPIIQDLKTEISLVEKRTKELLKNSDFNVDIPASVISILCQTFSELRNGRSKEGIHITTPKSVMSTAEEIAVLYDAAIYAQFFTECKKPKVSTSHLAKTLPGSVIKEDNSDLEALREYWKLVIKRRTNDNRKTKGKNEWDAFYNEGKKVLF